MHEYDADSIFFSITLNINSISIFVSQFVLPNSNTSISSSTAKWKWATTGYYPWSEMRKASDYKTSSNAICRARGADWWETYSRVYAWILHLQRATQKTKKKLKETKLHKQNNTDSYGNLTRGSSKCSCILDHFL